MSMLLLGVGGTLGGGTPGISLGAVTFDGNDGYERGGGLTGAADGDKLLVSFWYRYTSTNQGLNKVCTDAGFDCQINVDTDSADEWVEGFQRNAAGTLIVHWNTPTNSLPNDGADHHVLFKVDTNAGEVQCYIDDVDQTITYNTQNSGFDIDFTQTDWAVGSQVGGTNGTIGDIGQFWMAIGTDLDLDTASNRRKFTNASGQPIDLVTNDPGITPIIHLTGDTSTFATNEGSGGDFTASGDPANASDFTGY